MVFALDIWLLPAIAASSSSYLVCLLWERFRAATAPSGSLAGFLAFLSFLMAGASAYYRAVLHTRTLEGNIIVMFLAGGSTTFFYLLMRPFIFRDRK